MCDLHLHHHQGQGLCPLHSTRNSNVFLMHVHVPVHVWECCQFTTGWWLQMALTIKRLSLGLFSAMAPLLLFIIVLLSKPLDALQPSEAIPPPRPSPPICLSLTRSHSVPAPPADLLGGGGLIRSQGCRGNVSDPYRCMDHPLAQCNTHTHTHTLTQNRHRSQLLHLGLFKKDFPCLMSRCFHCTFSSCAASPSSVPVWGGWGSQRAELPGHTPLWDFPSCFLHWQGIRVS